MKRKTSYVVASVMCVLLALVMVLPMAIPAAAAEEPTTTTGMVVTDNGYKSSWKGADRHFTKGVSNGTVYGHWVSSDGRYNGAWQWADVESSKVSLDNENGIITFEKTSDKLGLKYYPGQVENPLKNGSAYLKFDIFYTSGSEEIDGQPVVNFPGLTFSYFANNADTALFSVLPTGEVYHSNPPGMVQPTQKTNFKMVDGWNTVEIIFINQKADNSVLDESGTTADIAKTNVAFRVTNGTTEYAETKAFTYADLRTSAWQFIEGYANSKKFYKDMGASMYLKPYKGGEGTFKLRDSVALNIAVETDMYRIEYEGFPHLTQGIAASLDEESRKLTIPAAKIPGGVDDPATPDVDESMVQYWVREVNGVFEYYKPGTQRVPTSNLKLRPAVGAENNVGELGSALDSVPELLAGYSHETLRGLYEGIDNAIDKLRPEEGADPVYPEGTNYATLVDEKKSQLTTRMGEIETATLELIDYADTFMNTKKDFDKRIKAFEAAEDLEGQFDATVSEEAALAVENFNKFREIWKNVSNAYDVYLDGLDVLETTERGEALNTLLAEIISCYDDVRQAYSEFTPDERVVATYLGNMVDMKADFDALTSVDAMFSYLSAWANQWNENRKVLGIREIPAELRDSVNKYNATVKALNDEILESTTMIMAFHYNMVESPNAVAMSSDLRSKLDEMFAEAQGEE